MKMKTLADAKDFDDALSIRRITAPHPHKGGSSAHNASNQALIPPLGGGGAI